MRPLTAILIAGGLYMVAEAWLPFSATHRLGEGCYWAPVASLGRLKLETGQPTIEDRRAQMRCFVGRGLKSRSLFLYRIDRRWPSKRRLTALERSLRDDRSFLAALPADHVSGGGRP